MNLVIPFIVLIAALAGQIMNLFIIEHDRNDWKNVLKRAIYIALAMSIGLGIINYFSMVKTIGINLFILFMVIFTLAFWFVYISFKMEKSKKMLPGIILIFILLITAISPFLMTKDLYGLTDIVEIDGKPVEIDTTHVRQVNYEYAKWKADKVVGELGNRVMIGELEIILYQGKLTWVCPLIHSDFF